MADDVQGETRHATCVAWGNTAVLIQGRSGQGKSALGLQLMALGCILVADDRVRLSRQGDAVIASCPKNISGLIEARGIGILQAEAGLPTEVSLVVDLDTKEVARLPLRHTITLLGRDLPLINRIGDAHFAPAILQILKAGWSQR
jgi:HPr kinase/phosphorylase